MLEGLVMSSLYTNYQELEAKISRKEDQAGSILGSSIASWTSRCCAYLCCLSGTFDAQRFYSYVPNLGTPAKVVRDSDGRDWLCLQPMISPNHGLVMAIRLTF
jgi:hypothetical protein